MSATSKNYYDILGVTPTSSQDEIKKAYRKLSLKYHPDKNNNETISLMASINEAYNVLSNEQQKQEYDFQQNPSANLRAFFGNPLFSGHGPSTNIFHQPSTNVFPSTNGHPPDEFIQMFFHGNPFDMFMNGPPNINERTFIDLQKPTPIIKTVTVSMYQIYTGVTIPIEIERWIYENRSKVFEKETIYVTIPQGVDENEIILLKYKGNVLNDSMKGDIKIFVKISNDTEYKRSGLDLMYERTISLKEALCGFTLQFTFLNGKTYTLNNLSGNIITPEYKKLIPNMGFTRGTHQGNLILIFHVKFPDCLTEEQVSNLNNIL
jgi:DnaJ-class molecular chaperone